MTLLYLGLYIIYWLKFDVNGLKSSEKMTTVVVVVVKSGSFSSCRAERT